jgi:hypothetical protein
VYVATFGRSVWSLTDYSAAPDPNENGGFETGSFSGWSTGGAAASIVTSSQTGTYAAQLGAGAATNGDSTASQTFTIPRSATTISFSYLVHCPDTVTYDWATATLTDNVTSAVTTILPKTCTNGGAWVQVNAPVGASAGHSVTLTLVSHDDNYGADPTYTWFDNVSVH